MTARTLPEGGQPKDGQPRSRSASAALNARPQRTRQAPRPPLDPPLCGHLGTRAPANLSAQRPHSLRISPFSIDSLYHLEITVTLLN